MRLHVNAKRGWAWLGLMTWLVWAGCGGGEDIPTTSIPSTPTKTARSEKEAEARS